MITANIDLTGLNRGIAGLIRATGLESKIVVAKEMGELEKTLVRLSPKARPEKIKDDISRKFELVGMDVHAPDDYGGKMGPSGILWYGVDSKFLRGIAPKNDKREASIEELKQLSYRITKRGGKLNLSFRNRHSSQRVLLIQSVMTKASTVAKLVASKKKNRGRLAAAWLAPVLKGIIRLAGSNLPPGFVMEHLNAGLRGDYVNGLDIPKKPTFTVINFAKGVGKPQVAAMMRTAVAIRIKAMQANALMFMRGKKRVSDYAR